jgi:exopolysaccharide production protein ExoY
LICGRQNSTTRIVGLGPVFRQNRFVPAASSARSNFAALTSSWLQERTYADTGRVRSDFLHSGFLWGVERIVAALGLLILAPFAIAIGVVVFALSRRNPLIRHHRIGWRGRPLPMLKFRTMWDAGEAADGRFSIESVSGPVPVSKNLPDSRVGGRFAAFCRRYSLDEIPQLVHVVRGEMSLIGPRPITRDELQEHYGPSADEVLSVRPGLIGLWQVRGRNSLSYAHRRRLDLLLVRRASPGLYFQILVRSIPRVLSGRDAY